MSDPDLSRFTNALLQLRDDSGLRGYIVTSVEIGAIYEAGVADGAARVAALESVLARTAARPLDERKSR